MADCSGSFFKKGHSPSSNTFPFSTVLTTRTFATHKSSRSTVPQRFNLIIATVALQSRSASCQFSSVSDNHRAILGPPIPGHGIDPLLPMRLFTAIPRVARQLEMPPALIARRHGPGPQVSTPTQTLDTRLQAFHKTCSQTIAKAINSMPPHGSTGQITAHMLRHPANLGSFERNERP